MKQPDTSDTIRPRVHLAGSVRWAVIEDGRIVVQFATPADLNAALSFWEQSPRVIRLDGNVIEFELPEAPE